MGFFKKEDEVKKTPESNKINGEKSPVNTNYTSKKSVTTVYKNSSESFISKELVISGEITGNSNLRIKGTVEGKIDLNANVIVEKESTIKADIKGIDIEISGTVEGNIIAQDKITLTETAVVTGNITCKSFTVKEGASFEGNINMIHSSNKDLKGKTVPQKS